MLVCRGIAGALNLILLNFAVKLIDPSDVFALLNTNLLMVTLMSRLMLGEKISLAQLFALCFSCLGVLLISQPRFLTELILSNSTTTTTTTQTATTTEAVDNALVLQRILGVSVALLAATASSFVAILVKKLNEKGVHYSITTIWVSYFGLPSSVLLTLAIYASGNGNGGEGGVKDAWLFGTRDQCALQAVYALVAAVCGVLTQIFMCLAMRYEDAAKVSLMRASELFFVFLLQFVFLDIVSNVYATLGAVCICASIVALVLVKMCEKKLNFVCFEQII